MSLTEFFPAMNGYLESVGAAKDQVEKPMTRDELTTLFDDIERQRTSE